MDDNRLSRRAQAIKTDVEDVLDSLIITIEELEEENQKLKGRIDELENENK